MNNKILLPFLFGALLSSGCNLLEDSVAVMKDLNCSLGSTQDCTIKTGSNSNNTYLSKHKSKYGNEIYYFIKPKYKIVPVNYNNDINRFSFVVTVNNGKISSIALAEGIGLTNFSSSYSGLFYDSDGKKITKAPKDWMKYLNKSYNCKKSRKRDQSLANTYPADYAISRIVKNTINYDMNINSIYDNDLFKSKDDLLILEDTLDLSEILSEIQNK